MILLQTFDKTFKIRRENYKKFQESSLTFRKGKTNSIVEKFEAYDFHVDEVYKNINLSNKHLVFSSI